MTTLPTKHLWLKWKSIRFITGKYIWVSVFPLQRNFGVLTLEKVVVSKQEVFFSKKLNHQSSRVVMKLRKNCGVNQGTAEWIRDIFHPGQRSFFLIDQTLE